MLKRLIRNRLASFGYSIERVNGRPKGLSEERAIDSLYFQLVSSLRLRGADLDPDEETLYTVYATTRYVVESGVPGHLVECGVGAGPKVALMCLTMLKLGVTDRDVFLYDTFEGLTEPSDKDRKFWGPLSDSNAVKKKWLEDDAAGRRWGSTPIDTVKQNLYGTGYPADRIHFVKGDVRCTLPTLSHREIAILRLDTDFYDSSLHELRHLYDLVVPGGVVIFDDYGGFAGQKSATDEFFRERGKAPLLVRTNVQERVLVK